MVFQWFGSKIDSWDFSEPSWSPPEPSGEVQEASWRAKLINFRKYKKKLDRRGSILGPQKGPKSAPKSGSKIM